jgi:uncharacterized membrane protein
MSASKSSSAEIESKPRPKPRIESLSDMIFGLALSVGAITLVGNVGSISKVDTLQTDIATFGFSFLILIVVWMRYTRIMSVLPFERRWTVSLNVALLFTVSLEPFLFNVMQLTQYDAIKDSASQLYAVDLGVMMTILAMFTLVLADESRNLVPKDMIREYKMEGITLMIAAVVFFVSTLDIFWTNHGPSDEPWRFYVWVIPFILSAIRRRGKAILEEVRKSRPPDETATIKQ